jgi:hypothetical protein
MRRPYRTHEDWIEAHREEFIGEWVALDGGKLLAHGFDARTVYDEARAQGVDSPYLDQVLPKIEAYIGG